MGFGVPMFDGDEPLDRGKCCGPQKRITGLWLGAVLAGLLGEGTGLPDRSDDQNRSAESEWGQDQD